MCTFRIRAESMLIAVHREVGNPLALDHSRSELVIDRDRAACRVHLSCHLEVAPGGAPIARAIWPPTNQDPGGSRTDNVAAFKRSGFPRLLLANSDLQQRQAKRPRIGHSFSARLPDSYGVDLRTHQQESFHWHDHLGMGLLIWGWESAAWLAGLSVAVSRWAWPAPSVPMLGVCSLLLACGGGGKVGHRLHDVSKISWNEDTV